jgi:hypothetical protein
MREKDKLKDAFEPKNIVIIFWWYWGFELRMSC